MTIATRRCSPTPYAWRLDPADSGGGLFFDLGSHLLDLLDFLFGPLTDVHGTAPNVAGGTADRRGLDDLPVPGRPARFGDLELRGIASSGPTESRGPDRPAGDELFRATRRSASPVAIRGGVVFAARPAAHPAADDPDDRGRAAHGRKMPEHGRDRGKPRRGDGSGIDGYYGGREDDFWDRPETWPGRRLSSAWNSSFCLAAGG